MLQEGLSCFIPQKLHYFSRDTDTQESPLVQHMLLLRKPSQKSHNPRLEPPEQLSAGLFEAFPSLPVEPEGVGAEGRAHLWFVGVEHGHLHVLPPHVLGLPLHRRGRGLLVVPTDADEEEQQGYGQGNGDTWHQDVQDFHFVLFLGILVIWFRRKKKQTP